jgi:lipopolysaccharide/colanic/teichoic acid biosynthesis glycosyltransferase
VSLDPVVEPLGLERPPGRLTWRGGGKRLFDVLASLVLAPLALPIIAAASTAILLTMGRPVFFRQARVGLFGRPFMILKLRTMRAGDAREQLATAMGDQRITPVGRCLRRFHIDELPQLWNVLTGEMSLVGPRPEQPALAEAYAREVPAFAQRTMVRPGITGLAQVNAGYAADLAETRVKLAHDLYYLKNCSFGLDVEICARTVWALLGGAGTR